MRQKDIHFSIDKKISRCDIRLEQTDSISNNWAYVTCPGCIQNFLKLDNPSLAGRLADYISKRNNQS